MLGSIRASLMHIETPLVKGLIFGFAHAQWRPFRVDAHWYVYVGCSAYSVSNWLNLISPPTTML